MKLNLKINLGRMEISSLLTWTLKVVLSLLMLLSFFFFLHYFFLCISFWIDSIAMPAIVLLFFSMPNLPLILFSLFFISPFVGFHFWRFIWVFFLSSVSLGSFMNIQNTVKITFLLLLKIF